MCPTSHYNCKVNSHRLIVQKCGSYIVVLSLDRWKEYSVASVESLGEALRHIAYGTKHTSEQSSLFTRMAVLEARAAKRFQLQMVAFFPFMFFAFGFVLGK